MEHLVQQPHSMRKQSAPRNAEELLSATRAADKEKSLAILARPDFTAVNWMDKVGRTALHIAADNKLDEVCLAILARSDFKAVNAKEPQGTALCVAAARDMGAVCQAILARPDFNEINARDRYNRTALHLAALHHLEDVCVEILARPDFSEINLKNSCVSAWPCGTCYIGNIAYS